MQIISTLGLTLVSALSVSAQRNDFLASAFNASKDGNCTGALVASITGNVSSSCISTALPAYCFAGIGFNPKLFCNVALYTDTGCRALPLSSTSLHNTGVEFNTTEFNYYKVTCISSTLPTSIMSDPTPAPTHCKENPEAWCSGA